MLRSLRNDHVAYAPLGCGSSSALAFSALAVFEVRNVAPLQFALSARRKVLTREQFVAPKYGPEPLTAVPRGHIPDGLPNKES